MSLLKEMSSASLIARGKADFAVGRKHVSNSSLNHSIGPKVFKDLV